MKLLVATVVATILVCGWWISFTMQGYPGLCLLLWLFDLFGSVLWIGFLFVQVSEDWNKV